MVENITTDQVKLEKEQRKAEEILHSNINEEKISQAWQQHERFLGLDQENKPDIHWVEASAEIRSKKEGIKRMRQSISETKELLLWKYKQDWQTLSKINQNKETEEQNIKLEMKRWTLQ